MGNHKTSIGGQALIEGIMMRGPKLTAISVRQPNGEINVIVENTKQNKFKKIPVLRGVYGFIDSMITGYKSLMKSADIAMLDEEPSKLEIWLEKKIGKKATGCISTITGVLGSIMAIVLFMVIPTIITGFISNFIELGVFKAVIEGVIKLIIFFMYLYLISHLKDVRRVFSYHGAEHKTISCYEEGKELTVENVKTQSRFHPRCGTSFLFIIVIISIIVFSFIPWNSTFNRVLLKILFLPLVVGFSYEILKFTGRYDNVITKILSSPGLFFQKFTTFEPDEEMIEVAIKAMKAVIPQSKEEDKW